ncbi:MAG: ABC transporter family protein [Alphaproteobacteria bacterium]|nr:ABC transporter family protein [Alphaproteobacteria bacterium]
MEQSKSDLTDVPLYIQDLSIGYKNLPVANNISLDVQKGEIFGLIGLNGVGKTTLIKTILDLRGSPEETILIYGQNNHDMDTRKQISYLPERFDAPSFLSGIEFIKLTCDFYHHKVKEEDIEKLADMLALKKEFLRKKVDSYSKGMRQKLGLIATVLTPCQFLILDEPMSGLDPMARVRVKTLLKEIKGWGKTVFLSSHILADLDELCDNVAVLSNGNIVYRGTPEKLRQDTKQKTLEHAFLKLISPDMDLKNTA